MLTKYGMLMHLGPLHPISQNQISRFKKSKMADSHHFENKTAIYTFQNFMQT